MVYTVQLFEAGIWQDDRHFSSLHAAELYRATCEKNGDRARIVFQGASS